MHRLAGTSFPYDEVATKLALSLAIGLLIGLEREWAQKAAGVRSFAITALLGTLTALASMGLVLVAFVGLCLLILLMNAHFFFKRDSLNSSDSSIFIPDFVK